MSRLGQQLIGWRSWQNRIRDPSLSALLVLEIFLIFLAAPLASKGLPLAEKVADVLIFVMVVIVVLLSQRWGAILSIVAALFLIWVGPSLGTGIQLPETVFSDLGNALIFAALTWVVAHAVFAPGKITPRRVQGAVVVYLNLALIFASIYRLIWELDPAAFNGALAAGRPGLLYFSLTTLTTTGYGDITAVDPLARGLANLEQVVGQFYVAVTIARLIALELADRRR